MAKARIFDLPETKGAFQLKGIVTGTEKNNFYKEMKTKSNKDMRIVNFGLEYAKGETMYINMQGTEQDYAYFYKSSGEKGKKGDTAKVSWGDRFSYNREGYGLIGKNIGVRKKIDADGKTVNDKKTLTDFDACNEIHKNLKDGVSVFTKGDLNYRSTTDDNGGKKLYVTLVPSQVSLCSDIDFSDSEYKQQSDFNQVIIFMGIEKEKGDSGKETGRFVVAAKIVTYSSIEDVEFIIEDAKLAGLFKKNLKPYNAIKVNGHMVSSRQTEVVDDDDNWGEEDSLEKVSAPTKREFIISGAKSSTIDRELYTENNVAEAYEKIAKANKAQSDFGNTSNADSWGEADLDTDDDDPWD